MSDNKDVYGRGADLDGEIADILSEVSSQRRQAQGDDSISEMARRYGVDVSGSSAYTDYGADRTERTPSYRSAPDRQTYAPRTDDDRFDRTASTRSKYDKYDEKGARIVFDAQEDPSVVGGRLAAGRSANSRSSENSVPLSVAERRRMIREKSENVRVLYDEDTATHAEKDAPFETIGERKPLPPVGDGKEKREGREKKKKKKEKKEMTRGRRIMKSFIPWNGDSRGECVRKIVMDVSFLVLLICALYFTNYFIELWEAKKIDTENKIPPTAVSEDENARAWAEIRAKYPDIEFPAGMNVAYADLYARNQDTVGYISIDGLNIEAPIVRGEDNNFYLKHNFLKVDTKYGQPYMDYRNNPKELDDNTIIYGHHMKDGLMFAKLSEYYEGTKDQSALEFYKDHPLIEYNTLFGNYKWKICAVFVTNNKPSDDNGYMFNIIVPNFHTRESLKSYIEAVKERSIIDTGVEWNENDKFLSLITCAYDFDDERLVVIARMVREGEDENVDVSLAVENATPRYPQKWYDVHKQTNPFRDAFRWEPNT